MNPTQKQFSLNRGASRKQIPISDLRGRKWTDHDGKVKYFNSLQAWRLAPISGDAKEPVVADELPHDADDALSFP